MAASEIAIGQKKSQFSSKCEDGQKVVDAGSKALDDLKASYKKADADNSFPVTWQNAQWDKVACQKQIVKLNSDIISRQELIKKYQQAVTLLDNQKAKVDEAQTQAKEQLAKIETNREMLKVQAITDDLKGQLVSMKGVLQTSVLDVASSDAGPMNLDEVAGKSAPAFDQGQFDKIMSK